MSAACARSATSLGNRCSRIAVPLTVTPRRSSACAAPGRRTAPDPRHPSAGPARGHAGEWCPIAGRRGCPGCAGNVCGVRRRRHRADAIVDAVELDRRVAARARPISFARAGADRKGKHVVVDRQRGNRRAVFVLRIVELQPSGMAARRTRYRRRRCRPRRAGLRARRPGRPGPRSRRADCPWRVPCGREWRARRGWDRRRPASRKDPWIRPVSGGASASTRV